MLKKIMLFLSMNVILLANSELDAGKLLSDIFNNKYECNQKECISISQSKSLSDNGIALIKNIKLNFKNLDFKYKKNIISNDAFLECSILKNKSDIDTCMKQYVENEQRVLFIRLIAKSNYINFSQIELIDNNDLDAKTSIKNVKLTLHGKVFVDDNISVNNLKLDDFVMNFNLEVNGIKYSKDKERFLNLLKTFLPIDTRMQLDSNNKLGLINLPTISKLNSSIINMYNLLSYDFFKNNIIDENLIFSFNSSLNKNKDLDIKLFLKSFDENIGFSESKGFVQLLNLPLIIDTLNKFNFKDSSKNNLLSFAQTIGSKIIIKEFLFHLDLNKIYNIHMNMLKDNKEYAKNYSHTLSLLNENKKVLKKELNSNINFKMFKYEIISMKHRNGEVIISNPLNKDLNTIVLDMIMSGKEIGNIINIDYKYDLN